MPGAAAGHCELSSLTIIPKGVDWLLPTPSVEESETPLFAIAFAAASDRYSTKFNLPFDPVHT